MGLLASIPEEKKYAVLRMLDTRTISTYLDDTALQKKLIAAVQKESTILHIHGIVLDLELPFTMKGERKKQITAFVQQLCTALHTDYKSCFVALYGDTFFQNRPYDVATLGKSVDSVILMAYDSHPAGGEPGPNFSFDGAQTYGYDFKHMLADFLHVVPAAKLEVALGMYGYDWPMNDQGIPLKQAAVVTTAQALALQETIRKTSSTYSFVRNDAQEMKYTYVDSQKIPHIVWFEDTKSAAVKTAYLQQMQVGQVSFWAWGYFSASL
jgi:spore germination protein YaaH